MFLINGLLVLEQNDISLLQTISIEPLDQSALTPEYLGKALDDLQKKADNIPQDAEPGEFMTKLFIEEGVKKLRASLSELSTAV